VTVKELADDEAAFGLEYATELADGRAGIGDLAEGADQVVARIISPDTLHVGEGQQLANPFCADRQQQER
jgi:hypothetical protein